MRFSKRNLQDSLFMGGVSGGVTAAVFFAIITGVFIRGGDAAFEVLGAPYPIVATSYCMGSVGAGAVVGLLWPLGRTMAGSACLVLLSVVPVLAAVQLLCDPGNHFFTWSFLLSAFIAIPVGIGLWLMRRGLTERNGSVEGPW